MLHLLFHVGEDTYSLEARHVVEIVPVPRLRKVNGAPPALAGLLDYRGELVPVVDLCRMTLGRPSETRLSTRIIVVHHRGPDASERLVGLMAEKVTDAMERKEGEYRPTDMRLDLSFDLGQIAADGADGMIKCLRIDRLPTAEIAEAVEREREREASDETDR